ncbi:MAG: STAS domain-containing protein, partial [Phycisphaerae bacterium]|nr:STAS domain-containing protein [Phycisphaerae bacterium]
TTESYGHAVILNIKGELTEDSLVAFQQAVDHQLADGREVVDIVLNFQEVPFIDSSALEYLLELQDQLAEKLGRVKLTNCDENICKILEITALQSVLEICRDVPEAVKAISN